MKPKNPNPFYIVYQSFWTELRLKGAVKEVFAVIYGRCAYSGNAAEISINAIATLTGLSRQTIISSIDALVKTGLLERLPAKSSRKTGHFRVIGVEIDSKGRPVRKSDLSNNTTGQVLVKDRSNNRTGSSQEIRPRINIVDRYIKSYRNGNSSIDLEAPDTFEGRNTL